MNDETRNDFDDLLTGNFARFAGRKIGKGVNNALDRTGRRIEEKREERNQKKGNKGCIGCGCVVPIFIGFFILVHLLYNNARPSPSSSTEQVKATFAKAIGRMVKLTGGQLAGLLAREPQFADKCDWAKLKDEDWAKLLAKQPQFADKRGK